MIRPVKTTNGEQSTVYGLTIRGVAALGAEWGVTIAAILLSIYALSHANTAVGNSEESTRQRILLSCREANQRHREAIPQIIGLVRTTPPKSKAEADARDEAINALGAEASGQTNPEPPRTAAGRQSLHGLQAFIQIIAPAYDCAARLAKFTKP